MTNAHRRAAGLMVVAMVLVGVAAIGPLHRVFSAWLASAGPLLVAHPVAGMALFVLLAALSAMVAFLSSALLLPAALHVWSEPACVALLWLGWIVGGTVAYYIAKYLGRPAVRALGSAKGLGRYEAIVRGKSSFGMVLLFQLAVPSEIPGYLFGLAGYSFPRFIAALALAELPYALASVYAGSAFMSRRLVPLVVLLTLAAILAAGSFRVLRRRGIIT